VLRKAKTWYADATFKLCRAPFKQLFSINAFVKSGANTKQVPLLFALMSGKKKSGHKSVLQKRCEIDGMPVSLDSVLVEKGARARVAESIY
ncbi:hypothetical protein LSH36_250g03034, partial [Paralvinella palmiformis]